MRRNGWTSKSLLAMLVLLLLAPLAAWPQTPSSEMKASCNWTPGVYTLGQPVILEILLPAESSSYFLTGLPAVGEEWGAARLRSITATPPSSYPGEIQVKAEMQIFAVGDVTLPPRLVAVNTASAAKTFTAAPPPLKIQAMLKEGEAPPPPAGLLSLPEPFPWGFVLLGIVLLVAALSLVFWLVRRRARPAALPPPPRVLDPDAWIRGEIERLLASTGDATARYSAISRVLREYLEIKTGLPFPDWTTSEAKRASLEMPRFEGEPGIALGWVLSLCDQVKFAKYIPSAEEEAALRPKATAIIEAAMRQEAASVEAA